jgi:hypothetical protein
VSTGDEASLIVANTPEELNLYDVFNLSSDVQKGMNYSFALSGATVG